MKKNGFAPLILLVVILVLLGGAFYFLRGRLSISISPNTDTTNTSVAPLSTIDPNQGSLFSGKLTRLTKDLQLFDLAKIAASNSGDLIFVYYSAGKFTEGDLKDYTRIIATSPPMAPGPPPVFILATKDFSTYILDDPNGLAKLPSDDYQNPYNLIDKSKISSTASFPTEQPNIIPLDNKYSLYFGNISTQQTASSFKDVNGNPVYETLLTTDTSGHTKLTSPYKHLSFYAYKWPSVPNKYIVAETKVVVFDSTGLPKIYSLTTPKEASGYPAKKQKYDEDMRKANTEHSTNFPEYPMPPHIGFLATDISVNSAMSFYKDYETAFPGACAFDLDTRVVNISDSDLKQIGSAKGLDVFTLRDLNSELYSLQYKSKMEVYDDPNSGINFEEANPGLTKPSGVSDYASHNPLLFVKDYWGRWVALGEWDIKLPGGCGKPVIYLYPQKDMEVTLKFNAPVSFTTEIPTYGDYWKVLAHKDGSLANLRPELTDCSKYDPQTHGSEYARTSCLTNNYPYLYWAGNIASTGYPKVNQGWVVSKSELKNFIDEKLTYMGLNEKEKWDFESYWIPEMLKKDSNYYRISFLNTSQLNSLFPMTVIPVPDTVFRIFLDWQAMDKKPLIPLEPQSLEKLVRNGFTMVEWGGLK